MSLQGLGARKVRSLEHLTGQTIVRGYLNNAASWWVWFFTTDDHRHGEYNTRTGEWHYVAGDALCTSLCLELFVR
jgi:hypothetical protein